MRWTIQVMLSIMPKAHAPPPPPICVCVFLWIDQWLSPGGTAVHVSPLPLGVTVSDHPHTVVHIVYPSHNLIFNITSEPKAAVDCIIMTCVSSSPIMLIRKANTLLKIRNPFHMMDFKPRTSTELQPQKHHHREPQDCRCF